MEYRQKQAREVALSEAGATQAPAGAADLQPEGNAAAQAQLRGEPVDITAVDANGGYASWWARLWALGEASATVDGGLAAMVDVVLARACDRPIGTLEIHCHGSPGVLWMGQEELSADTLPQHVPTLRRLAGHFAPTGRVELHVCSFGRGEAGDDMVWKLSEIWGVPVTAGTQIQNSAIPGMEGSELTWFHDAEGYPARIEEERASDGVLRAQEDLLTWLYGGGG